MSQTRTKIRYGLILQSILAESLRRSEISFVETPTYDEQSEVPDFLIPDDQNPSFVVETHQTDTRDHFRMKTLRSLTAITEAKSHFGASLVSINVLFGDPDSEVPEANLRSMTGIFDLNVLVRREAGDRDGEISQLEFDAMALASDTTLSTQVAARNLIGENTSAVELIGDIFHESIVDAVANPVFQNMWDMERTRRSGLAAAPSPSGGTYFKRNLVRSLFFRDEDFEAMVSIPDPNEWPPSAVQQLVAAELGELSEEMHGDELVVDQTFAAFLHHVDTRHLRQLCWRKIESDDSMRTFFEDIRDETRRARMTQIFLDLLNEGRPSFVAGVVRLLESDDNFGVVSHRCWLADLLAIYVQRSQNAFNNQMVSSGRDPQNYQYPFNHITGRFERLLGCPDHFRQYAEFAFDIFEEFAGQSHLATDGTSRVPAELEQGLLELRLFGANRLQKMNPLHLILESAVESRGLSIEQEKVQSLLFDLAGGRGRLGKFDVFRISSESRKVIAVTIAAYENPTDKAKEWAARMTAMLYRIESGNTVRSEFDRYIFITDGTWNASDFVRLHRAGWDVIVGIGDIDAALSVLFE